MLSKEELLKPRYKVVAGYPDSKFQVGQIIQFELLKTGDWVYQWAGHDGIYEIGILEFAEYPHLFKKLEWWEDRKIEDLPEYVRFGEFDKEHAIYKVKYFTGKEVELYAHYMPCGFAENMNLYLVSLKFPNNFPATHEEYEQYQQSK
jgi:hypothetical protein